VAVGREGFGAREVELGWVDLRKQIHMVAAEKAHLAPLWVGRGMVDSEE
jgi:hypothetical protein